MGLFDKFRGKKKDTDKGMDALGQVVNKLNQDLGGSMKVYKCPNGCVDAILSDRGQAPACPKCGSRGVLR